MLSPITQFLLEILALVGIAVFIYSMFRKTQLDGNMEIAAHSGDSETMTFRLNLHNKLTLEEREEKVMECFALIQARRTMLHEAMEEIRKKSAEENARRKADLEDAIQHAPPGLTAVPAGGSES